MNNKKNTNFNKLTSKEKRIAVAKDALSQLLKGRFRPVRGEWVSAPQKKISKHKGKQLQEVVDEMSCRCCQLGALFLSDVRFRNDFKVRKGFFIGELAELSSWGDEYLRLADYFDHDQLRLIEIAYEGNEGSVTPQKHEQPAMDFGKKYKSNRARMIAILENIIENDGTFIPVLPARLNFNKTKKYNISYLKDGREFPYQISRPIEETKTHFTSYAYGKGLRTFKKNLVTSIK